MKVQMELFQEREFPEMAHSVVDFSRRGNATDVDYHVKCRGQTSERESIAADVMAALALTAIPEEFAARMGDLGYEIYFRDGEPVGVKGKRKYRFQTLGLSQHRIELISSLAGRQGVQKNLHSSLGTLPSR